MDDKENMIWAPNWSHTKNYALDVWKRLSNTQKTKAKIANELVTIGDDFVGDNFRPSKGVICRVMKIS
jgi:hypothetical protein